MSEGLRKELRETEGEVEMLRERLREARLTLRDTFAAAALTGLMAHPDVSHDFADALSNVAYDMADAMLAAREGK